MNIFGESLILSKIAIKYLGFIYKIECDQDLWYYEKTIHLDKNVVREEYIAKIKACEKPTSYDFVVTLAANQNRIGLAQIWCNHEIRRTWEIGFAILPEYSGKGYGCEAAQLLLQFAFERLHAHKVVGMCHTQNKRSGAVMKHIGMTKEATFKEELFWHDQWVDQDYFSILEKEYFENSR
ncbi:GNAT family N-acetyltransferase [Bacillus sp. CLL-7-23]|uniref:GNAT family N-acetyltransferase n=1 Tax=Bacillus changyiensis TaxID=3004103 RepID=A0ABT4X1S8_9BACI|nr:GNAT family N-acetyltransferase [Bacillus changyiensis]MDA7026229.1 GNAT family N-acetyltransferase [Bacillus changyiensis]